MRIKEDHVTGPAVGQINTQTASVESNLLQQGGPASGSTVGSSAILEVDVLEVDLLVGVLDTNATTNDLHVSNSNSASPCEVHSDMANRVGRHVDLDIANGTSLSNSPLECDTGL